jgi:hypothetical protein
MAPLPRAQASDAKPRLKRNDLVFSSPAIQRIALRGCQPLAEHESDIIIQCYYCTNLPIYFEKMKNLMNIFEVC